MGTKLSGTNPGQALLFLAPSEPMFDPTKFAIWISSGYQQKV